VVPVSSKNYMRAAFFVREELTVAKGHNE